MHVAVFEFEFAEIFALDDLRQSAQQFKLIVGEKWLRRVGAFDFLIGRR